MYLHQYEDNVPWLQQTIRTKAIRSYQNLSSKNTKYKDLNKGSY